MAWRFSWSQLSMHNRCPFEWYGKYRMKLVPYKKYMPFMFGGSAHLSIETSLRRLMEKKTEMSVAEMVGVFSGQMKREGVVDPDTLQYQTLKAQTSFTAWKMWLSTVDFEVVALENKMTRGDFTGVVDCMCMIDGQKYIVDWKTSARKYSQKRTHSDGQLTAYLWLTDSDPTDTRVAQGVLIKGLTQFQFLTSQRTEENIKDFLENLQNMRVMIKSYKSPEDPIRNRGKQCEWCDLYKIQECEGMDDF